MKLSNKIKKSFSLKENNLLKIDSTAKFFIEIFDFEDLKNIQNFTSTKKINFCILGEGSNVVLPNLLNKFVIKISFNEISIEDNLITVGAGKNWDDFVLWSLENGYCGLENLSGIPGSIGAAPIQNIGAYGSEVSDFIDEGFWKPLKIINKKHDLIGIKISDPAELNFPNIGLFKIFDEENNQEHWINSSSKVIRDSLSIRSKNDLTKFRSKCKKNKFDLIEIDTEEDYVGPLINYFKKRGKK